MNSNSDSDWMSDTPEMESLLIGQLILPGTHDSGSDKQASGHQTIWEITQDVPPLDQILHGIRALDIRVRFYEEFEPGDNRRFQLFHYFSSGRTVSADVISALMEFYQLQRTQREIIVVDFHEFDDFTPEAHQELQALLAKRLGTRVIPYAFSDLTLGELWTKHPGRNIVVAYNHGYRISQFWLGVSHRWMGVNTPTAAELKEYMDSTIEEYKHPEELVSIQCAKYLFYSGVPDDFNDKIDEWFKSVDENSYIQNFHIINTDWTTRSQLVKNCKHANKIRAELIKN